MKSKSADALNFEKGMEQLKRISDELESGALSLDDSLKTFEEGIRIYRVLNEKLNAAELKIETVLADLGQTNADESGEH